MTTQEMKHQSERIQKWTDLESRRNELAHQRNSGRIW